MFMFLSLATLVFACWQDVNPLPDGFKVFLIVYMSIVYAVMKLFGMFDSKEGW